MSGVATSDQSTPALPFFSSVQQNIHLAGLLSRKVYSDEALSERSFFAVSSLNSANKATYWSTLSLLCRWCANNGVC